MSYSVLHTNYKVTNTKDKPCKSSRGKIAHNTQGDAQCLLTAASSDTAWAGEDGIELVKISLKNK